MRKGTNAHPRINRNTGCPTTLEYISSLEDKLDVIMHPPFGQKKTLPPPPVSQSVSQWNACIGVNFLQNLILRGLRPFLSPPLSFPPLLSPPLRSRAPKSSYGSGERCKLPQRGLGRSPSRNRIWCILALKSVIWWQQF